MKNTFYAVLGRMKYIRRWALMHNSRDESLSEHTTDVAVIAHALCLIANRRYGRHLNAERAAVVALYHDAAEVITGDAVTPVKHGNERIEQAYREIENEAEARLLDKLPDDLREDYEDIFRVREDEDERYMRRLVKAADKISALIKCIEERSCGNSEFRSAEETTKKAIAEMEQELPEVKDFMENFMEYYGNTLDELMAE